MHLIPEKEECAYYCFIRFFKMHECVEKVTLTWLQAMHSTAKAGVFTLPSWVRKKAGPRNPIDCIICNVKKWRRVILLHTCLISMACFFPVVHRWHASYLSNWCNWEASADKVICNPTTYISEHSHSEPWKHTKQSRFREVEIQNLHMVNMESSSTTTYWSVYVMNITFIQLKNI